MRLRDVIKTVPLDRLLVETDAPFLAPVPHRGKTNEPAFVVHTAAMLAELKGVSEDELAAATTDNFFRLFSKVKRPGMTDMLEVRILGCGSSGGVPRLGGPDEAGNWGACDPANPKNRRRRCSILVHAEIRRRRNARAGGHLARHARADCWTRGSAGWMAC